MLLEICLILILCVLYYVIIIHFGDKIDKWMDERIPQWITPGKMVLFTIVSAAIILGAMLFF